METPEHNSRGNSMHANNSRDVRSIRNARNVGNTSGRRDDKSRRKAAIAETTAIAGTPGTKQKETSGISEDASNSRDGRIGGNTIAQQ
jgi:hypothetical protein